MGQAIEEAKKGLQEGEVPVGALLIGPDGAMIASAHNQPIALNDPTAHAEILVLRSASAIMRNYRLMGSTVVVTVEPCLMCMGSLIQARVSRLIFGAFDPKAGAAGSIYNLADDHRLNHRIEVVSGIMAKECGALLQDFFRARRIEIA
ncbi:MAG: nucleoside deaminase [Deltaproteobacteria bacterium]|nr:nucleoside deaminase [Deltaproteobacteria bacterium]